MLQCVTEISDIRVLDLLISLNSGYCPAGLGKKCLL